jgi:uncharacterized protein (TIGR02118 family)
MAMKVHVLYGKPTDPAAFEEYYRSVHAPLAEKLPNLQSFEYGKGLPNADGSDPAYFWLATLTFADAAGLGAGMAGPEGKAAADDVPKFATGGVTVVVSEF